MTSAAFSQNVLKAGDLAPDFFLPDEGARLVSLASLLAKGPVVVAFLAGSWCSYCLGKLRALSAAVRDTGASVVAITPETGAYPRRMKADNRLDGVVLSDVDYGVGLLFGVIYVAPPPIVASMAARGLDLAAMHGVSKPMLPAPASFVIARSGRIALAAIGRDYTADVDTASVKAALAKGA
jgi:peroxiredoxin